MVCCKLLRVWFRVVGRMVGERDRQDTRREDWTWAKPDPKLLYSRQTSRTQVEWMRVDLGHKGNVFCKEKKNYLAKCVQNWQSCQEQSEEPVFMFCWVLRSWLAEKEKVHRWNLDWYGRVSSNELEDVLQQTQKHSTLAQKRETRGREAHSWNSRNKGRFKAGTLTAFNC